MTPDQRKTWVSSFSDLAHRRAAAARSWTLQDLGRQSSGSSSFEFGQGIQDPIGDEDLKGLPDSGRRGKPLNDKVSEEILHRTRLAIERLRR